MTIFGNTSHVVNGTTVFDTCDGCTEKMDWLYSSAFLFFFLLTATLNPFLIHHKLSSRSIPNLLFVCLCTSDLLTNIYQPLYTTVVLLNHRQYPLYRNYTAGDVISTAYVTTFSILSEVYITLMAIVRARQIKDPLAYMSYKKVAWVTAGASCLVVVGVVTSVILKIVLTGARFNKFSQKVEHIEIDMVIVTVETVIFNFALWPTIVTVYRLCKKKDGDVEQTEAARQQGGKVILIMSTGMIVGVCAKNTQKGVLQDLLNGGSFTHNVSKWRTSFLANCMLPCFMASFNTASIVMFNRDVRSKIVVCAKAFFCSGRELRPCEVRVNTEHSDVLSL